MPMIDWQVFSDRGSIWQEAKAGSDEAISALASKSKKKTLLG